jgi:hypothetical protein
VGWADIVDQPGPAGQTRLRMAAMQACMPTGARTRHAPAPPTGVPQVAPAQPRSQTLDEVQAPPPQGLVARLMAMPTRRGSLAAHTRAKAAPGLPLNVARGETDAPALHAAASWAWDELFLMYPRVAAQ